MKNTSVDNSATLYELSKKVNIDGNDYIVESYGPDSDFNWYRVYKSGWIEQGGMALTSPINLLKEMSSNYSFLGCAGSGNNQSAITIRSFTTTTVNYATSLAVSCYWRVEGQGA